MLQLHEFRILVLYAFREQNVNFTDVLMLQLTAVNVFVVVVTGFVHMYC